MLRYLPVIALSILCFASAGCGRRHSSSDSEDDYLPKLLPSETEVEDNELCMVVKIKGSAYG